MGSSRTSLPVVQEYVRVKGNGQHSLAYQLDSNTPVHVVNLPNYVSLIALVDAYNLIVFVASLVATLAEYLFPEIAVTNPPNLHVQQYGRGVRRNLVAVPPPRVLVVLAHPAAREHEVQIVPNRYQRHLVLLISAFCSPIVIALLSNLIGPANLPTAISWVGLSLDLPGVLDIVNEPVAHVAQSVTAADPTVCLFETGRALAKLVCVATYGADSPVLTVSAHHFPHP